MRPTITVDVGTTSVKLSLFDDSGTLLAGERHPTPSVTDQWGDVYDVDALTGLLPAFVRDLDAGHRALVERIAFTGVGESGGLVRPDLSLASPVILWHDNRGAALIARLDDEQRSAVYRVTGLPANANYGLSKAAWAVEQLDGIADGATWLNVSEFLAARLTGERWSEFSLASRTMALDLDRSTWSPEIAALVGLDVDVFPDLRSAADGSRLTPAAAAELGLSEDVLVHVAGHDHIVGAIGADLRRGELLNSTGTTEGLLFFRAEPSLELASERAKLANGVSSSGADFSLFASIPTGGSAFATLQSLLGLDETRLLSILDDLHRRYLAGDIDLGRIPLVLPRFRGSPPPTKDASARGGITGIGTDTTVDELVFGVFLGMTLQFRDVLELFPDVPDRIKVIGPASRNPLWLQLKADLLGTNLSVSTFPEVVSRGAQSLASGATFGWESCDPHDVVPDPVRSATLQKWADDVRPRWVHMKGAEQ